MGVWSHPFASEAKAKQLIGRLQFPWQMVIDEDGEKSVPSDLYDLVGCDRLYDNLQELDVGDDIRNAVKQHVSQWLREELDSFLKKDMKAVQLLKHSGLFT